MSIAVCNSEAWSILRGATPVCRGRRQENDPKRLHKQQLFSGANMVTQVEMERRLRLVEEHVRAENKHDLDRIMATFGDTPRFVLNGVDIVGHDAIRGLYESFGFGERGSFSDVAVSVRYRHMSANAIVLELSLSGRHSSEWQGVAATGRLFEVPLCAVITFDPDGKMAGERVYFDSAVLLRQLGALN